MTFTKIFTLSAAFIIAMLAACNQTNKKTTAQEPAFRPVSYYYGEAERDTLLVDLVTYIGRKPPHATAHTRFEPQFRTYYTDLAKNFTLYYYSVQNDLHTFYLSRPARTLEGNRRGVLGTFRRNEEGKIVDFREVLNTVAGDEERIRQLGRQLMEAFLTKNGFDELLNNRNLIEWPDSSLKYDTTVFEWRYVPYAIE